MSNNPAPLPLKIEPDERNTEPLNVEPLATEVTKNPLLSLTEAVTLPLAINDDTCASSVKAERGISNNPAPLPLKIEPEDKKILPLNVEPLSSDLTTNPN
jgi:hypothetical protein